jgi:hypothetical protein
LRPDFTHALPPVAAGSYVDPKTVWCTVEDVQFLGTPQQKQLRALPPCNPDGEPSGVACWALLGDPTCTCQGAPDCPGARMLICRNGFRPQDVARPCPQGTVEDEVTAVVRCVTTVQ